MDRILAILEPVFFKVMRGALDHILGPEIEFWYFNDSVLYTLCLCLKRDSRLKWSCTIRLPSGCGGNPDNQKTMSTNIWDKQLIRCQIPNSRSGIGKNLIIYDGDRAHETSDFPNGQTSALENRQARLESQNENTLLEWATCQKAPQVCLGSGVDSGNFRSGGLAGANR
jgi:hypothetical protein